MAEVSVDRMRSLLGKNVAVTMGVDDGAPVIARGRLLGFGDGGDFEVRDDETGLVHFCWPWLDIEEEV